MILLLFDFAGSFPMLPPTSATSTVVFNDHVGFSVYDASIGNKGVSVEIRTNLYNTNSGDFQYFWVGDRLNNGKNVTGLIQFGYVYEPGDFCLRGSTVGGQFTCLGTSGHIGGADPRWMWQYWANAYSDDFVYGVGPVNSVGFNGTWHNYTIAANGRGGWSFLFDSREISYVTDALTKSLAPAYFVAEKGSDTTPFGQLGPVEFRNLAYLEDDGWHNTTSLHARVACSANSPPDCRSKIPYGVMSEGAGVVITGSGVQQPKDLDLLWMGTV